MQLLKYIKAIKLDNLFRFFLSDIFIYVLKEVLKKKRMRTTAYVQEMYS